MDTAHLRVTHCEVLCWVIPFWRMTSTESLIIVCFCPDELQYNPSTTGIFLVSIQYLKLTGQMLIFGLQCGTYNIKNLFLFKKKIYIASKYAS